MRSLTLLSSVCLLAAASFAQTDRGTITGTIQDPTNAVVAGALVVVKNAATGGTSQTTTTSTGNFTLPALPAGVYEVTAEAPGFKKYVGQGTQVEVAQVTRLDISLQVGSAADSVTVEASAPLLMSDSVEQSV